MPSLILPGRFRQQPQFVPRLASAYQDAELLAPCLDGTGSDIARGNHLLPGAVPARTVRQHGYTLNFNGSSHYLVSARTVRPGIQFSVFAWVRPIVPNTTYARIIETDYSSGFYLGSNTASRYCWIVNNASLEGCVGGQQVAGQRDFVCGVFDGSNRILYVNGVQVASSAATAPSVALPIYISRYSNTPGYYWNGDIDTVGLFNRALGPAEIWSLYQNSWQLFKAPSRRLWFSPATYNLAGAGLLQANKCDAAGINQLHVLSSAPGIQPNAIEAAAIGQDCALVVEAGTQVNTASNAGINVGLSLSGTGSAQANISETVVIRQGHGLAATVAVQANSVSSAEIALGVALSILPCNQTNAFSATQVTQVHALAAVALVQANSSASTAVAQTQALSGSNATQQNACATPVILLGTGALVASSLVQVNLSGSATITLTGAVPDVFLNSFTVSRGVRKPGIPKGTPEWLKTFLEIISGRRGNRIGVPALEILTFSTPPTKAECEALYAYVNSVRASIVDLINRLDG